MPTQERPDYAEPLSPAEELVLLCLRERRTEEEDRRLARLYAEVGDPATLDVATANKVVPMTAHGLVRSLGEPRVPEHWRNAHRMARAKTAAFMYELDRVSHVLAAHDVPVVLIENGSIARGPSGCLGCFASSDVEVLVERRHLDLVGDLLVGEGYERTSRARCMSEDPARWDRDIRGWDNYQRILDDGVVMWLNVQWRPVLRRWVPMGRELSTVELVARSVPASGASTRVRLLAPDDNLLVCSLHTASHSYVRGPGVRLQLDVDRIVRRSPIDWDRFVRVAKAHDVAAIAFPSLAIPRAVLGTPIPAGVLEALVPSARRRRAIMTVIERASIFNRHPNKLGRLDAVWLETNLSDRGLLAGLSRVLLPPGDWTLEAYAGYRPLALPFCYAHRLIDLVRR